MLLLLLAVDATIVSESSSIDLSGSVGLAFEGALIGNYDEEANPQGTLTRPGLFGGSGNQPISSGNGMPPKNKLSGAIERNVSNRSSKPRFTDALGSAASIDDN